MRTNKNVPGVSSWINSSHGKYTDNGWTALKLRVCHPNETRPEPEPEPEPRPEPRHDEPEHIPYLQMEPEYDSENLKELLYINNPIMNFIYIYKRNDFNALTDGTW